MHILLLLISKTILLSFYYAYQEEAWWNTIGKTQPIKKYISLKAKHLLICYYVFFVGFFLVIFLLHNNINNTSSNILFGFKVPFKKMEYPNNRKVIPYTDFLKEHAHNPKQYLLSLFDKYDIVILSENLHYEDTQWDFIYEVVTDTEFVGKVGHIFTEYGCARDQAKVDSFMYTSFPDTIALAKATATLMNFHSGNFYFFMKKLHSYNHSLLDSLCIQVHFTDILSWKYWNIAYYDSLLNGNTTLLYQRDSLMAQVIIDWFEQTQKKCLVITNYRHSFAVKNTDNLSKYDNEAQYIYNKFPKKTANVLFHGQCTNGIYMYPVQHGLWNRAMKQNGNISVGFDFDASPFGKDNFDMFPAIRRNRFNCSYKDVFTGYIFYKPEEEFMCSEPCYRKYAADLEYQWAIQNQLIDTLQAKRLMNSYQYKNTGGKMDVKTNLIQQLYFDAYHVIELLVWGLWSIIVFLFLNR